VGRGPPGPGALTTITLLHSVTSRPLTSMGLVGSWAEWLLGDGCPTSASSPPPQQ
jgi:hypothetical protein